MKLSYPEHSSLETLSIMPFKPPLAFDFPVEEECSSLTVLLCPRVESAIVEVATELDPAATEAGVEHKAVSKVRRKARGFLQEMVANISPAFIRYSTFQRVLSYHFI